MRPRPQKNLSKSSKGTSSNETMPTSPMPTDTRPTAASMYKPEAEYHDLGAGSVEYVRLALMALVVVASMTGWWKPWMTRDWLAFTATLFRRPSDSSRSSNMIATVFSRGGSKPLKG